MSKTFARAIATLGLLVAVSGSALAADPTGGKFDGTYSGRKTQNGGKGCSAAGDVTLKVREGVFMWGVKPNFAPITIAPSGAIEGVAGNITVKGTASANALDFDTTTAGCFNHWRLDKQ